MHNIGRGEGLLGIRQPELHRIVGLSVVLAIALLLTACGDEDPFTERAGPPTCGETSGTTVEPMVDDVPDAAKRALVHLPPCYDSTTDRYPVMYLLHGGGGRPDSWVGPPANGTEAVDQLTVDGMIEPVIMMMPGGASGRPEFNAGEFDIVLALVDATFRTIDSPSARVVGGVSAGGTSAAYLLAENESTRFAAAGFFMSVWGPAMQERVPDGLRDGDITPSVLIAIGEDDGLRRYTDDMVDAFESVGIEPEVRIDPGAHDFTYFGTHASEWLLWLGQQLSS